MITVVWSPFPSGSERLLVLTKWCHAHKAGTSSTRPTQTHLTYYDLSPRMAGMTLFAVRTTHIGSMAFHSARLLRLPHHLMFLVAIPGSTGAAICITQGYNILMTANSVYHSDSERLNLLLVDQESAESEKGPESKKGNFYSW